MKKVLFVLLSLILVFSLLPSSSTAAAKEMKFHFINVGQGDSILIQSPNGKNMLIDGGSKSAGPAVVKFLKDKKVSKLDFVVATHPDADHIGGLIDVLKTFSVGIFVDSGQVHSTQTYLELLKLIDSKHIKYIVPKAGDKLALDTAVTTTVLNSAEKGDENNEASIVLQLKYIGITFLLMGDADVNQEKEIMAKYNVRATVLKAGHHGSNTSSSSAFINAVKPKETILSYAKQNSYGHPHKDVVANLKKVGSKIYSTAEAGNITITTDGKKYSVSEKPTTPAKPAPANGLYVNPKAPKSFKNCTELRKWYKDGVKKGHPAYAPTHDRDKDSWACER